MLQPTEAVRPYTEAIVAAVLEAGPLPEPSPPNLLIDPVTATGPSDTPLGPYTVSSDSADPNLQITVSVTGGTVYADAAGTQVIDDDSTVANGSQIWLLPEGETEGRVTLTARGVVNVPSGNVYLYDGNTTGVNDAQRLILAQDAEVSAAASATGVFYETSSLRVTKTIAGAAAGQQGSVTLRVSCDNGLERDIEVAAGTPAGDTSTTIDDLPVGTVCTITESADGSSASVTVTTTVEGSPATIAAEEIVEVTVTNTYETEEPSPSPTPSTSPTPSPTPTPIPSPSPTPSPGSPPPSLPQTGTTADLGVGLAGVALLAAGALALVVARRRR